MIVKLNEHQQYLLISASSIVVLLLIWELITVLECIEPLYLPGPAAVLRKLVDVASDGYMEATLWQHSVASFTRIALSLTAAVVVAVPTGLLIGLNRIARAALDPLIEFYRPVPPLAYLPLIVIWFGIGELSKDILIYLAIFAPIAITTATGVQRVDPTRIQVAQSLGASKSQIIRFVIIPSALPEVLTGIRIGLGAGWSTLVAAELIAATQGLGFMIQSASQFLMTDLVVGGILLIAMVAYVLEISLRQLQKKLLPWQILNR